MLSLTDARLGLILFLVVQMTLLGIYWSVDSSLFTVQPKASSEVIVEKIRSNALLSLSKARESTLWIVEDLDKESEYDALQRVWRLHEQMSVSFPTPFVATRTPASLIWGEVVHIGIISGGSDFRRNTELMAMVNSLLFHRTCPLHFHVIDDEESHQILYDRYWKPREIYEPHLKISFYDLEDAISNHCIYPDAFYKGSRIKACVDDVLPEEVEKLIIIDTDCIVVKDVRFFWEEFNNFTIEKGEARNESQTVSDPPALGLTYETTNWYKTNFAFNADSSRPGFGMNGGVVMLHLGRLRKIEWNTWWKFKMSSTNPTPLQLGDQDIWNYIYRTHRHLFYLFPLEWNMQSCYPWLGYLRPTFNVTEVGIVHGNCGRNYDLHRWQLTAWCSMTEDDQLFRELSHLYWLNALDSSLIQSEEDKLDLMALQYSERTSRF